MVCIDLSGKVAIVTGGGRGIGGGISKRLAEAGAQTIISDINLEIAEKTAQECVAAGWKATAVKTDVSVEKEVQDLVAGAIRDYGKVDILVCNAGIGKPGMMLTTTSESFDKIIAVNLKGVYYACMAVLPNMIENGGGNIINISSMSARRSPANLSQYGATKAAVANLTQAIANEYGPQNIKANAVCPGVIRTEMFEQILAERGEAAGITNDEVWAAIEQSVPLRRGQTPEDIANTVLFLASPLAENISSQLIHVNGGQCHS